MTDAPTTPERAPDTQQQQQRAWPLSAVVLAVVFGLLFAWLNLHMPVKSGV